MSKRALICGVSGQDGAYLARLLLEKGYEVHGTSRNLHPSPPRNLLTLGIQNGVSLHKTDLLEAGETLQLVETIKPDEVYHLAGQSSVGRSFDRPLETLSSIGNTTVNLLEAIRALGKPTRLYHAGSSESFGNVRGAADETTPFRPLSPYGIAKAGACWHVTNYREAFGMFACNGILFNHESPLRPAYFVTRKVVSAACRIAAGSKEKVEMGNLSVRRDWGWAPEYVEAMWRMLQLSAPEDFVISTGESHSLEDFVTEAFARVALDWRRYVTINAALFRPIDIRENQGNSAKALAKLGWSAKLRMKDVVGKLVEAERAVPLIAAA